MNYKANDLLVAKKYAQSFMRVSGERINFTDISKIESAQLFLSRHKNILFFLQLNQFDTLEKDAVVADFIGYFSLPQCLSNLLLLVIEHNRSSFIPTIFSFIIELYRAKHKVVHFAVTSYPEINSDKQQQVKCFLANELHCSVTCSFEVDKNLIAGIAARSVDYMWEYSVRKKLQALRALSK